LRRFASFPISAQVYCWLNGEPGQILIRSSFLVLRVALKYAARSAALLVVGSAACSSPAVSYNPPFDVPRGPGGTPNKAAAAFICPPAPPATQSIDVPTRYAPGGNAATVDPVREAAYKAAIEPTNAFLRNVALWANRYVRSNGADVQAARCAERWITAWAKAGAWTSASTSTGWFKLSTSLSGTALSWLQIASVQPDGDADRKAVLGWMTGRADALRQHQDGLAGTNLTSRNNHRYWAGLALGSVGAAAGDRRAFDWGMGALRQGACDVTPEGWLPAELTRRNRALWYHVYSLQPLVLLAEFAEHNRQPGYALCNNGIHRLANATLAAVDDPAKIAAAAGIAQTPVLLEDGQLRRSQWGWLAPYGRRFGLSPQWQGRGAAAGRLAAVETGGDLLRLYPVTEK
jgi:poly(beta-D-mannuronate) lyase